MQVKNEIPHKVMKYITQRNDYKKHVTRLRDFHSVEYSEFLYCDFYFDRVGFRECLFSKLNFSNGLISGCALDGTVLRKINIENTVFYGGQITCSNFDKVNFKNVQFVGTMFYKVSFRNCKFENLEFKMDNVYHECNLVDVEFDNKLGIFFNNSIFEQS